MRYLFMILACHLALVHSDIQTNDFWIPCGTGKKPAFQPYKVFEHLYYLQCLSACDSVCVAVTFLPDGTRHRTSRGKCSMYTILASYNCNDMVNEAAIRYYEKRGALSVHCFNGGTWNGNECDCVPSWVGFYCERMARDCSELYEKHVTKRGEKFTPFEIKPHGVAQPFLVLCYMNWGGFTYLAERPWQTCTTSFNYTWAHYKEGFGDFTCDFWLGLDKMHAITSQRKYVLDVTMYLQIPSLLTTSTQEYVQAYYHNFWIDNESNLYKIHMVSYSNNQYMQNVAGDSMFLNNNPLESVVGQPFSTFDADNDKSVDNCAQLYGGGWWFNDCTVGYLTGIMTTTSTGKRNKAQKTTFWKYNLDDYVIKAVNMKVTPAS